MRQGLEGNRSVRQERYDLLLSRTCGLTASPNSSSRFGVCSISGLSKSGFILRWPQTIVLTVYSISLGVGFYRV